MCPKKCAQNHPYSSTHVSVPCVGLPWAVLEGGEEQLIPHSHCLPISLGFLTFQFLRKFSGKLNETPAISPTLKNYTSPIKFKRCPSLDGTQMEVGLLHKFLLLLESYFKDVYISFTNVPYIAMRCNREEWNGKVRARQSSLWCTCYYLQLFIVKTWLHVFILHVSRILSLETSTLKPVQFHWALFH